MFRYGAAFLTLIALIVSGCKTSGASHLGKPIRIIENPVDLVKYQDITDSYIREMESWRTDAYTARPWWIDRIEIYAFKSQRPEDNPALQGPSPVMRDPSSLKRLENPPADPAPPDSTLP
jgi:hypothetical protein